MMPCLLFVLLVLPAVLQQPAALPRTGSIEGIVVRLGTQDALDDARVEVLGIRTAPGSAVTISSMTTSVDGKFLFRNLEPGEYQLRLSRNGYVRQEFGPRVFSVSAGQALKGLVVPLTPTGSVTGRIRNRNGEPLVGLPVQLMRVGYDEMGRKALQPFGSSDSDQTNDRGEYRLFFITPGKYYLYAGTPAGNRWTHASPTALQPTYTFAFYPGVSDFRQASTIVVEPGSDIRGIDLTLPEQPSYRVKGRVIDARNGTPPVDVQIRLSHRAEAMPGDFNAEYIGGEKATYADGVFEFRNVVPGAFLVSATIAEKNEPPSASSGDWPRRTGYAAVDVTRDVENVVITIPAKSSLSGSWKAERPGIRQGRFQLTPLSMQQVAAGFYNWNYIILNPDGTLFVENLVPGEYRLSGDPAGFYIKEARYGAVDVLTRPLRFSENEVSPLEIVFASTSAVVEGRTIGEKLEIVPHATVVLVPNRRERPELFRTANSDQNGRFTISNVIPGDYRVFAWDVLEPNAYFDPDLIKESEFRSVSIRLSDSSRQSVDVRLSPPSSRTP